MGFMAKRNNYSDLESMLQAAERKLNLFAECIYGG